MSIYSKINLGISLIIMLIFATLQISIAFYQIPASHENILAGLVLFILFIPFFILFVIDFMKKNNKEYDISQILKSINNTNLTVEFDIDSKVINASKNFCDIMGYTEEELIGKPHYTLVPKEQIENGEYQKHWEILKSGEHLSSVFKRVRKDGQPVWIQANYNPVYDDKGKIKSFFKLASDITEKVKQSTQIEEKNAYLEHASKIIRHDMHSGINTYIPRGVKSLRRKLDEKIISEYKIESSLRLIEDGLKHTQKVYKSVYEFTNLVRKDSVLSKQNHNLADILKEFLTTTPYNDQVIVEGWLPSIEVNEPLFCIALDNLVRNGLKYNDSETKMVAIFMEDDIHLAIQDNGRGMTHEEFLLYSQPYVRKDNQKEKGTGLGLNICIAILKEHNFPIFVEKNEIGTKIKIKIK